VIVTDRFSMGRAAPIRDGRSWRGHHFDDSMLRFISRVRHGSPGPVAAMMGRNSRVLIDHPISSRRDDGGSGEGGRGSLTGAQAELLHESDRFPRSGDGTFPISHF